MQQSVMNWILALRRVVGVEADTAVGGISLGWILSMSTVSITSRGLRTSGPSLLGGEAGGARSSWD